MASPGDPGRLAAELWATVADLSQAEKRTSVVCAQVRLALGECLGTRGYRRGSPGPGWLCSHALACPPHGLQLTLPPEMELTLIPISYSFEGQAEISSRQTTLLPNNLPTHLPSA